MKVNALSDVVIGLLHAAANLKDSMKTENSTEASNPQPPVGVKIRCENWFWNRKLQILLSEAIGCQWGTGIALPWNTQRKYLVVQKGLNGWYFSWATENDFARCPLPEWTAKELIAAYPGAGA